MSVCLCISISLSTQSGHEVATYCFGYLLQSPFHFGGWHRSASSSCAWWTIQRYFSGKQMQWAVRTRAVHAHSPRCTYSNNDGDLGLHAVQSPQYYVKSIDGQGSTVRVVAKADCPVYANFDRHTGRFYNQVGTLKNGTHHGRRYVAAGGKAALLKTSTPFQGYSWLFVQHPHCLQEVDAHGRPHSAHSSPRHSPRHSSTRHSSTRHTATHRTTHHATSRHHVPASHHHAKHSAKHHRPTKHHGRHHHGRRHKMQLP